MAKFRLPMPIELAGLTGRMTRANNQEKDIAALGKRYDKVQGDIDYAIEAHTEHLSDLEHYRDAWTKKVDSMVLKTNGGSDPLDDGSKAGQSGRPSPGAGQAGSATPSESQVVTSTDVGSIEQVLAPADDTAAALAAPDAAVGQEPDHLTVNGVQT